MENESEFEQRLLFQREFDNYYQAFSRFQLDLEFIQMLANPKYLHYLARNHYFYDEKFRKYLQYLEYFRDPRYFSFIKYPQCLKILELLNKSEEFTRSLGHPAFVMELIKQQSAHWLGNLPVKLELLENPRENLKEPAENT